MNNPTDEFSVKDFNVRKFISFIGPGLLMSIAYLDPGNVEADLTQGINSGYSLLWVLVLATCVGLFFQILAVRLGLVTSLHLAQVCRKEFPLLISIPLWIIIELALIGSDVQEVVGSAIGMNILFGLPIWIGVLITSIDTFFLLLIERYGFNKLEILFAFLIAVMSVSFGYVFFLSNPQYFEIFVGSFVPKINEETVTIAVGMIGSVIMPHNLFLHSALVLSRGINRQSKFAVEEAIFYSSLESFFCLAVSLIINLFIISVFSSAFHYPSPSAMCSITQGGEMNEILCSNIGLSNADGALSVSLGGNAARIIWGIGLFSSGQASTMSGVYSGQFVMNGFLNLKVSKWKRMLISRSFAIIPSIIFALLAGGKMDVLLSLINVINSLILPFALTPLLIFTSSSVVMGSDFVNSTCVSIIGSFLAVCVLTINIYLTFSNIQLNWEIDAASMSLFVIGIIIYIALLVVLIVKGREVILLDVKEEDKADLEVYESEDIKKEAEHHHSDRNEFSPSSEKSIEINEIRGEAIELMTSDLRDVDRIPTIVTVGESSSLDELVETTTKQPPLLE